MRCGAFLVAAALVAGVTRGEGWSVFPQAGQHLLSAVRDTEGAVWFGSEGDGVHRFQPDTAAGLWTKFTTNDGLGDDYAYALACDRVGRIWVGHLNRGVSIFDGERWRNYDVPFGPIGERVNEIAVCPTDGDVWLGTSAGLTRYSDLQGTWTHYTRADGLPANGVRAIAFASNGTVFVGSDCEGIAFASPDSGYRRWSRAPLADPDVPAYAGHGLPSPAINDLLVASDGRIYAATCVGLAFSGDGGATWLFRRGRDYPAKVADLEGGPPKGWKRPPLPDYLLPEDFVTCLAEGPGGTVWLGFRQQGVLAMNGFSQRSSYAATAAELNRGEFPRALLPTADGGAWLALYGGGVRRAESIPGLSNSVRLPPAADSASGTAPAGAASRKRPFPPRPGAPDLAELNELLREVEGVPIAPPSGGPSATPLEDDWRTQGQWIGRHGKFLAVLCAQWSPRDDVWGAGWDADYQAMIGGNKEPGDSIRYWVHWLQTADNRCLEMSPTYLHSRVVKGFSPWELDRREAEWDDHGEAYPPTKDGPHLYLNLTVPAGLFILSLYDINPNGHDSVWQPRRDYTVSVREFAGEPTSVVTMGGKARETRPFHEAEKFRAARELARGRLCDFWGGVYKRFVVTGPARYTVRIGRNHSYNTILAGAMLDLVDELPPPYFETRAAWEARERDRHAVRPSRPFAPVADEASAAIRLAAAMRELPFQNAGWWAENRRRVHLPLLRWHLARAQPGALNDPRPARDRASSFHALDLFEAWEAELDAQGLVTARGIEKALRWDLITYDCSRQGNRHVVDYLAGHPERFPHFGRQP